MRYRLRFTKLGPVQFIGHLDLLNLFQRAIKRASLPIAYSEGFNPHQLIYIACPLALGQESSGEYADLVLEQRVPELEIKERLNEQFPSGIQVLEVWQKEKGKKVMALVDAADYEIRLSPLIAANVIQDFSMQDSILAEKKTKKKTENINMKPDIFRIEMKGEILHLTVSTGSARNIKPVLVVKALFDYAGFTFSPYDQKYVRKNLYCRQNTKLISLGDCMD